MNYIIALLPFFNHWDKNVYHYRYFSTLSVMSLDTGGIKALRALRVLRPLKFIAGCRRECSILSGFVLYEDLRLISFYKFPRQKISSNFRT